MLSCSFSLFGGYSLKMLNGNGQLMGTDHDIKDLDHGLFQFSPPTGRHMIGYGIAIGLFVVGFLTYSTSLTIPDVPRVDEAEVYSELQEPDVYDYQPVQAGYDSEEYNQRAAFILVNLELQRGQIAYDSCEYVEDDDGGGSWSYSFSMAEAERLTMVDLSGQVISPAFSLENSLSPEGEFFQPSCNSHWSRSIEGNGPESNENYIMTAFLLVEEMPLRYQLLSVHEVSSFGYTEAPPEVTQREDRGRFALLFVGFGGLIFMYSIEPSLKHDLRRIRRSNRSNAKDITSGVGVLGHEGRLFQHLGPNFEVLGAADLPRRSAETDWLFGAPQLPSSYDRVFAADGDGALIREHPRRLGSPQPGTITLYSIGAIIFSGSFIWLAADLRARDGSSFHTILGWGMTAFVTLINVLWFYSAWNQFRLQRTIHDLPTSPVRSVAVGQAEIVGQVRPSIAGTPEMTVGGRTHQGLVLWQWKSYHYECNTDSEGNTSCSWSHVETMNGGVPFIVHDGTGGILIDPVLWEQKKGEIDRGKVVDEWTRGDWKWKLTCIGVGDPIYLLGDCEPRKNDHLEAWGSDPTLPNALVTIVPSTDTGEGSVLHYGTELDVLANMRSTFEILIVPMLVFLFGIFMFINYTP